VVTVCRDFDRVVARQLDGISVASCGYLSPVTDPFQPVESEYRLSEKIIGQFVRRNIPVEIITKSLIPERVIDLVRKQRHSFGQVSILTPREELRRRLMAGGAPTDELFGNLKRLSAAGVHAVCRIDPIVPGVTDDRRDLLVLIARAVEAGARHVVASVMDVPRRMSGAVFRRLDRLKPGLGSRNRSLYSRIINGTLHADLDYRRDLFSYLRRECDRAGVSFALCMEYRLQDGVPAGLNAEFASAVNCEGIDVPVYVRRGERFAPAADCRGDCLACLDPICGIEDLAMGRPGVTRRDFTLRDYRRWSRQRVSAGGRHDEEDLPAGGER
jgi:DNA repair photolyase